MSSPGAPTLLLVPTARELDVLEELGALGTGRALTATCGFGPVAAAARSAHLLASLAPRRVVLVGIAGTYDPESLPVESATTFAETRLDGVGAGEGDGRLGPPAMGLEQVEGVGDRLPLAGPGAGRLLTVCAASADPARAAERARRFDAQAEDMEAFGVALACHAAGVPLTVVRGISNRAGDRDRAGWRIEAALAAAHAAALAELGA